MSTVRRIVPALAGVLAALAAPHAHGDAEPAGPRFVGFADPIDVGLSGPPIGMDAGDLDGDGLVDLVGASRGGFGGTVAIWLGRPDGTFAPQPNQIAVPNGTVAIALADLDADGHLDLVAADGGAALVQIHWGAGAGAFESGPSTVGTPAPSTAMTIADGDGDGIPDLATAHEDGTVSMHLSLGTRDFAAPRTFSVNAIPGSIAAGDLDGDGDDDLAVGLASAPTIRLVRSDPDALAGGPVLAAGSGAADVAIADILGTSLADVATVTTEGDVRLWNSVSGFSFQSPQVFPLGIDAAAIAVGDLDNDGDREIVVSDGGPGEASSRIHVLVQDADGFAEPMAIEGDEAMVDLVLFDLDGNTSLDLLGLVDDEEFRLVRTRINVTDVLPPGAFELAFPQNGQTGLPRPEDLVWEGATARLRWTEAAGFTVRYRVRIADNPELVDPAVDVDGIESVTWDVPPGSLSSSFTWYWSVEACNAAGFTTAAPAVSQFTMTCREDLDGDGTIGVGDVLQILTVWGTVCGG